MIIDILFFALVCFLLFVPVVTWQFLSTDMVIVICNALLFGKYLKWAHHCVQTHKCATTEIMR